MTRWERITTVLQVISLPMNQFGKLISTQEPQEPQAPRLVVQELVGVQGQAPVQLRIPLQGGVEQHVLHTDTCTKSVNKKVHIPTHAPVGGSQSRNANAGSFRCIIVSACASLRSE